MREIVSILSFFLFGMPFSEGGQRFSRVQQVHSKYQRSIVHRDDRESLTRVVLKNGLTVLIEEHPSAPLISVVTFLKTNSFTAEELRRDRLLSKLILSRPELNDLSYEAALDLRSKEGLSGPSYVSLAPANHLEKVLEVHANLLRPLRSTDQDLQDALSLLGEQDPLFELSPEVRSRTKLLSKLFSDGQVEDLGDGLLEALVQRHKATYHSSEIILSISGAVLRESVLGNVVRIYGRQTGEDRPDFSKKQSLVWRPAIEKLSYHHIKGPLEQAYIQMGYSIPGRAHPDHGALMLLAYLLGRGRSSFLHQRLLEPGKAVRAFSRVEATAEVGVFRVSLVSSPDFIDSVEVETLAEVESIQKHGPSKGQLNRAKSLFVKDFYEAQSSLEKRSLFWAEMEEAGRYWSGQNFLEGVQNLDPVHIQKVAVKYLGLSHLTVLEYYPEKAGKRIFSSASFRDMLDLLVPLATVRQQSSPLKSVRGTDFVPIEFKARFVRKELKSTSVLRGPSVYFQEEHTTPLVHIGIFYPGGRIEESIQNSGITELMIRSSLRSAMEKKGTLSWHDMELQGVEVQVVNEPDFFGVRCTAISRHLPEALNFLIEWFQEPALDAGSLEVERQVLLSEIQRLQNHRRSQLLPQVRSLLFGSHPYALNRLGTLETVSNLELKTIDLWLKRGMEKIHPWIFLIGDIEGTSFLKEFVSRLSNRSYQHRWAVRKGQETDEENVVSISDKLSTRPPILKRNGTLTMGLAGPAYGTRDSYAADVWRHLLLSSQVRRLMPATSASLVGLKLECQSKLSRGALFVSGSTIKGREQEARHELLTLLSNLPKERFSKDVFLSAIVGAITRYHARLQDGPNLLLQLALRELSKTDFQTPREYVPSIKSVTPSHIRSFAKRYFPGQGQGER